jgi:hypothetical protein
MSVIATGPSNGIFVKAATNIIGFGATIAADGSFVSSSGASIRNVTANPTGTVTAAAGSLALRSNGSLYLNTDGTTNWLLIGSVTMPGNSVVPDPGNAGAIANNLSGSLALTYGAGAETRTLANPIVVGQVIAISVASAGAGTCAITVAGAINQAGNTVMTFNNVADFIQLTAINRGGNLRWQVSAPNDGVVLS